MAFKERLDQELVSAAKSRDKVCLSALRMVKSGLHNREIDLKRELDEAEFLHLLSGMVKQRKDSIEQFQKGGREDLVAKEVAELLVIEAFLPAQLSEGEIDALIVEAMAQTGAADAKDMGRVMKVLMPQLAGRADGKMVGEKVRIRLSAMRS